MPIHDMWNILRDAGLAVSGPIKMAWICWAATGVMLILARDTVRRLSRGDGEATVAAGAARRVPRRPVRPMAPSSPRGASPVAALTPLASSPHAPSPRP